MRHTGFGEPLRKARVGLQLTQQQVADELINIAWTQKKTRVGIDRQMVSKWEREIKQPDRLDRELLCLLYGKTEGELGFLAYHRSVSLTGSRLLAVDSMQLESPLDIAERMQTLTATNVGDPEIDHLDSIVQLIIDDYETSGPVQLSTRVVRQRKIVQGLLLGTQLPRQRQRLYEIAARLSALLGYMAVNLGKFSTSKAYSREAFLLSEATGDTEMQAWIRGTESFCCYYMRDYEKAVDLARDGLRYARGGPQGVRLAINGEARALAKLRDGRGVTSAVEAAYRLADKFDTVPGVSPCISLGIYSAARTASNAVTAYVSLGQPEQVEQYSRLVMPAMEASDSCWTQSLVRLDIATAMVSAKRPEPEQAASLVTEALNISAERPITSVILRSREFFDVASRWNDVPAIAEAAETLRSAVAR